MTLPEGASEFLLSPSHDPPRGSLRVPPLPDRGRLGADPVRLDGDTVWLTQAALAELDEAATCKDYLQVRQEGARRVRRTLKHYSLPMILAIGYRVRSPRGVQFRRWATRLAAVLRHRPEQDALGRPRPHRRRDHRRPRRRRPPEHGPDHLGRRRPAWHGEDIRSGRPAPGHHAADASERPPSRRCAFRPHRRNRGNE